MNRACVMASLGSAVVVGLGSGAARGQYILTGLQGWDLHAAGSNTNNGATNFVGFSLFEDPGGVEVLRGRGRVTEPGDGMTVRDFTIQFQTLNIAMTLNGMEVPRADIVVPLLSDYRILFGGGGANPVNISNLHVEATVELRREATAGAGDYPVAAMATRTYSAAYMPPPTTLDQVVRNTNVFRFENVDSGARRYQVRVSYGLSGTTTTIVPGLFGDAGTFGEIDMDTAGAGVATRANSLGASYGVSVEPNNYTLDSRALVSAANARAIFGVDGSGVFNAGTGVQDRVKVGVLEPNSTYTNHASLAGRVSVLAGNGAANWTGEHALAVASIIAGSGPDAARSGLAPGAQIISASSNNHGGGTSLEAADALIQAFGALEPGIINFSQAGEGAFTVQSLDRFVNNNRDVTWVSAAGNFANTAPADRPGYTFSGSVPNPNYAYNIISVGALDGTGTKPAIFSSKTAGSSPRKPDLMAPGEYILSAASRDIDGNGTNDDYTRSFLGDDWRYRDATNTGGATVGSINGTSFAAPMVTGAVALLHDYAVKNGADFDGRARDQRVMKAIILAGADTHGIKSRGNLAWNQSRTGTGNQGSPVDVFGSLDTNLGAGKLDAASALRIYSQREIRQPDNNAAMNFKIFAPSPPAAPNTDIFPAGSTKTGFWDLERVAQRVADNPGTVDYILGSSVNITQVPETGNFIGTITPTFSYLRSCLTWNATTNAAGTVYNPLSNLQLRLFLDNPFGLNTPGYDPADPMADILVAETTENDENVKLFDLDSSAWQYNFNLGQVIPPTFGGKFYLEVANTSLAGGLITYGLAVSFIAIPAPGAAGLLALAGMAALRRRRTDRSAAA